MSLHPIDPDDDSTQAPGGIADDGSENAPSRPTRPSVAPPAVHAAVDQTGRAHTLGHITYLVMTVILAGIDVFLIVPVWDAVLLQSSSVSWGLALLTAIGATLLAWTAGLHAAVWHTYRHSDHAALAILVTVAWCALGVAISVLRWNSANFVDTTTITEGGSTNSAADPTVSMHHLLAIVLIAMYLLPGTLAFAHAYMTSNPVAAQQRRTFKRLTALRADLPRHEARASELGHLLGRHYQVLATLDHDAMTERNAAEHLAEELRHRARAEAARHIGQPWAVPAPVPGTNGGGADDEPPGSGSHVRAIEPGEDSP